MNSHNENRNCNFLLATQQPTLEIGNLVTPLFLHRTERVTSLQHLNRVQINLFHFLSATLSAKRFLHSSQFAHSENLFRCWALTHKENHDVGNRIYYRISCYRFHLNCYHLDCRIPIDCSTQLDVLIKQNANLLDGTAPSQFNIYLSDDWL